MKRKILAMIVVLSCWWGTASAQALIALLFGGKMKNDKIKLGIYLGASSTWITEAEGQRVRPGLAIGAYTAYIMNPKWELCMYLIMKSPGGARSLRYDQSFAAPGDSTLVGADFSRFMTYIHVSPVIRYKFSPSWSVALGPQLAGRLRAKDTYSEDIGEGTSSFTYNTRDYISLIDVGMTTDLQYTLMKGNGIRLDIQYNMGFINIYNDKSPFRGMNRQLMFGVGIPIGRK
ncbi:outer membrane beta-barrel protein [Chitinophaga lutea]